MTTIYLYLITEARLSCVVAAGPKVRCTIINILLLYIQFMLIPSIHLMHSKTISGLYFLYVHIFYSFYVHQPEFLENNAPSKPYVR
jgi:hypothetical protein